MSEFETYQKASARAFHKRVFDVIQLVRSVRRDTISPVAVRHDDWAEVQEIYNREFKETVSEFQLNEYNPDAVRNMNIGGLAFPRIMYLKTIKYA